MPVKPQRRENNVRSRAHGNTPEPAVSTYKGRTDTVEFSDKALAGMRTQNEPLILENFKNRQKSELYCDPYREVDPDGSIYRREYFSAYIGRLQETVERIENYYAGAREENSRYGPSDLMMRLHMKYVAEDSPIFRSDMSAGERNMSYKQEMALYFGGHVTLKDPYALAAYGGPVNSIELDKQAKQAAENYLKDLIKEKNTASAGMVIK